METDPDGPDRGPDREAGREPGRETGSESPPPDASREYSYGEEPMTAAADSPTAGDSPGAADDPDPAASAAAAEASDPATGSSPATETRLTAPRAVLRPVPEGFPTPPPRPAVPNRRPALASPEPPAAPRRRRGLLIGGLVLVVVLLLVVAVGGGVLAYRALSSSEPAASPAREAPVTAAGGEVQIGDVTVRQESLERGVRSVGSGGSALEPEGEYVVVGLEIVNDSSASLSSWPEMELETADGQTYAPDAAAGRAHIASTTSYGVVPAGEALSVHLVYDVPIGAEPAALQIDLSSSGGETGSLPLSG